MKMNGEDIFKALENTDENFLEECQQEGGKAKIIVWKKWAAVAACAALAVTSTVVYLADKSNSPVEVDKAAAAKQQTKETDNEDYTDYADDADGCGINSGDSEVEYLTDQEYWDLLDNYDKYQTVDYNGKNYMTTWNEMSEEWCDQKLDSQTLEADAPDSKTETKTVDIYSIKGVDPDVAIAVKFPYGETASYLVSDYRPADFSQLARDFSLESNMKLDYAYKAIDASTERMYDNFDTAKVFEFIKAAYDEQTLIDRFNDDDEDFANIDFNDVNFLGDETADEKSESQAQSQSESLAEQHVIAYDDMYAIYGSIDCIGEENLAILFWADGYMDIEIGGAMYSYYIGFDNIKALSDYLENNSGKKDIGIAEPEDPSEEAVDDGNAVTTTTAAVTTVSEVP